MKFRLLHYFLYITLILLVLSCKKSEKNLIPNRAESETSDSSGLREISEDFKNYWYQGKAEITSYRLSQERYGSLRDGTMVTIFVTEDFNSEMQVKANAYTEANVPVLKFNWAKKFLTGIYPYSIMTSAYSPVNRKSHAIKVSLSAQEWCGHVYMQLNNRESFEVTSHSYFETEGDRELLLEKTWMEDEVWNLIRINPELLPTGEIKMLPSFESIRLRHRDIKAVPAIASLKQGDSITSYQIKYPDIQREVAIYFNSRFPFEIEKWEETNAGSIGDTTKMKTTAVRMKRIKSAYWMKNNNKDEVLRDSLGL